MHGIRGARCVHNCTCVCVLLVETWCPQHSYTGHSLLYSKQASEPQPCWLLVRTLCEMCRTGRHTRTGLQAACLGKTAVHCSHKEKTERRRQGEDWERGRRGEETPSRVGNVWEGLRLHSSTAWAWAWAGLIANSTSALHSTAVQCTEITHIHNRKHYTLLSPAVSRRLYSKTPSSINQVQLVVSWRYMGRKSNADKNQINRCDKAKLLAPTFLSQIKYGYKFSLVFISFWPTPI